jgi:hypothetical protein
MDLGPLYCRIGPRLTCPSQELSRYPYSTEEKVPPHLVQDACHLLVCLFTTIMREMTELSFRDADSCKAKCSRGERAVQFHAEEALKGSASSGERKESG